MRPHLAEEVRAGARSRPRASLAHRPLPGDLLAIFDIGEELQHLAAIGLGANGRHAVASLAGLRGTRDWGLWGLYGYSRTGRDTVAHLEVEVEYIAARTREVDGRIGGAVNASF